MSQEPIDKLLREADAIIAMGQDLANRGFPGEAACFALAAAQRLQLARIIEGIAALRAAETATA
jgi:hypothetical protein